MGKYTPLPAPADDEERVRFQIGDAVDHLLEIELLEPPFQKETDYGVTRVVRVNLRDLTTNDYWPDTLLFQGVLVATLGQLAPGATVLAFLRRGVAKPGKSAPYLLVDASQDPEAVSQTVSDGATTEQAVEALKDLLA